MEEREIYRNVWNWRFSGSGRFPVKISRERSYYPGKNIYNSSEVFTADRGYQTVPGAGETGHCHIGRITAAQPCSV